MTAENTLLSILVDKINNDTLVLPTLPAIALKVRKAAEDPEADLNKMADVIALDPSLSARIVKIANSAYMNRTVKAESIQQAVTRIGLLQIRNTAMALAMEQLYVSKNAVIKQYLENIWQRNVNVMSHALVLFQLYVKRTKNRELNADTMTLAGLLHNIGVLPVLTEAERHQEMYANPKFLNLAFQKLAGQIGTVIVKEWGLGDEYIRLVSGWRNLKVVAPEAEYIDFVRLGAVAAGHMEAQRDTIIDIASKKQIIEDFEIVESDEYQELFGSVKGVFS